MTPLNCGKCVFCCQNTIITLIDEDPEDYLTTDVHGFKILQRKENGDCVYLDRENGCTKYEHRPEMCQVYDCRKFYKFLRKRHSKESINPDFVKVVDAALKRSQVLFKEQDLES